MPVPMTASPAQTEHGRAAAAKASPYFAPQVRPSRSGSEPTPYNVPARQGPRQPGSAPASPAATKAPSLMTKSHHGNDVKNRDEKPPARVMIDPFTCPPRNTKNRGEPAPKTLLMSMQQYARKYKPKGRKVETLKKTWKSLSNVEAEGCDARATTHAGSSTPQMVLVAQSTDMTMYRSAGGWSPRHDLSPGEREGRKKLHTTEEQASNRSKVDLSSMKSAQPTNDSGKQPKTRGRSQTMIDEYKVLDLPRRGTSCPPTSRVGKPAPNLPANDESEHVSAIVECVRENTSCSGKPIDEDGDEYPVSPTLDGPVSPYEAASPGLNSFKKHPKRISVWRNANVPVLSQPIVARSRTSRDLNTALRPSIRPLVIQGKISPLFAEDGFGSASSSWSSSWPISPGTPLGSPYIPTRPAPPRPITSTEAQDHHVASVSPEPQSDSSSTTIDESDASSDKPGEDFDFEETQPSNFLGSSSPMIPRPLQINRDSSTRSTIASLTYTDNPFHLPRTRIGALEQIRMETFRTHPHYQYEQPREEDGLYHCPWHATEGCGLHKGRHAPTDDVNILYGYLDIHLMPYACKETERCGTQGYACIAGYDRHRRREHGIGFVYGDEDIEDN